MPPARGFQGFIDDIGALLARRKADAAKRQSLFENVSPGNVGNTFEISPSDIQFANTYNPLAYGTPVRILDIVGEDVLGEMICVSIMQERILDEADNANAGLISDRVEGPLVGVVEYGAGAGISTFEFDIPVPNFTPGFVAQQNTGAIPPPPEFTDSLLLARRVNSVLLSLPASSLRVLIRNDANAPYLLRGRSNANGDFDSSGAVSLNRFKNPAKVRVHATYGRRPFQSSLTRSVPICFAQVRNSIIGPTQAFAPSATASAFIRFNIPALAKRVRLPRQPLGTTALIVNFYQPQLSFLSGGSTIMMQTGSYSVPAGSEGPVEISPYDSFIEIINPIGSIAVSNLTAVFELGI